MSKGSKLRPIADRDDFASRWDAIFGSKGDPEVQEAVKEHAAALEARDAALASTLRDCIRVYIVDIDQTICYSQESDYVNAEPDRVRISKINSLYDAGHTVIYWTARGAQSGKDWREFTVRQLQGWGCKYSEVRFGKPHYDVWIDDKAMNSEAYFNT